MLGEGGVYVVDGSKVTHSNLNVAGTDDTPSLYDVCLHVLAGGDGFDLDERRPILKGRIHPTPAEASAG